MEFNVEASGYVPNDEDFDETTDEADSSIRYWVEKAIADCMWSTKEIAKAHTKDIKKLTIKAKVILTPEYE